jgi:TRAP-type transport system small permease protein
MVRNMLHIVSHQLNRAATILVMGLLLALFINVLVGASLRSIFSINFMSSFDLTRILFVWCTFIGASVVYKEKGHSVFSFLHGRTSGLIKLILDLINHVLTLGFLLVVVYFGAKLTVAVTVQSLPASGISVVWLYLPLAVSAALMLVHCLSFLIELRSTGSSRYYDKKEKRGSIL